MTIKELKELLAKYPDTMRIAQPMHSEWTEISADEIKPLALFNNGGYLSRAYRTEDQPKAQTWLAFPGN